MVASLTSTLLVITGDHGPPVEGLRIAMESVPTASLVVLRDWRAGGFEDLVADRTHDVGTVMMEFLSRMNQLEGGKTISLSEGEGEIAGISYRIQGSGPPLVLLPLFLSPSQWDYLVPTLSEHYSTITLGGAHLGAIAALESRGHSEGYLRMVRTLIEVAQLHQGETVLDVGCGTGVLDRWLAHYTGRENQVIGVDLSRYLLREAKTFVQKEGLEAAIEFREGNAEALPFPDDSFDVTMSVTVIEEVDANQMLAEFVRVTKPGGRVAVVARALDMPFMVNLPLRPETKAKAEVPQGGLSEHGCADASLYQRFYGANLTHVKMFPYFVVFDRSDKYMLDYMEARVLPRLSQEEAEEWQMARARAGAEGTFFMTWPHHCAVGTKSSWEKS
jgi:ubiquinone/menaquinone biosynthesis C-methylase UbiE